MRPLPGGVKSASFTIDALFSLHSDDPASIRALSWSCGREAEGAGLLNQYTRKGIEGSNPSGSATTLPVTSFAAVCRRAVGLGLSPSTSR